MKVTSVIRTIEEIVDNDSNSTNNSSEYRLVLSTNPLNIIWTNSQPKTLPKKKANQLFKEYNPKLGEAVSRLNDFDKKRIQRVELGEIIGVQGHTLQYYIKTLMPQLEEFRRKPIPLEHAFELIALLMPMIEKWLSAKKVSEELGISSSTVQNYCKDDKIEAVHPIRYWRISPLGVEQLKDHLNLSGDIEKKSKQWKSATNVAKDLGYSRSGIEKHCKHSDIGAQKSLGKWIIPIEGVSKLKMLMRGKDDSFEFVDAMYYSLPNVAKEAARRRGLDPEEHYNDILKGFVNLRKYDEVKALKKNKRWYIHEDSKEMLCDLIKQADVMRETGLSKMRLRTLMKNDVIKHYDIGPTRWVSYNSLQEYKEQHPKK